MHGGNSAGAALRAVLCVAVLSALAACAGTPTVGTHTQSARQYGGSPTGRSHLRNDHPPGPPEDPWGPYIKEASGRFGLPENWIRQVMRVESGGQQNLYGTPTTSPVGAMGLMQVMPGTYGDLKVRYNLGDDPYDPHDNIMAGVGYLREMYDRFGSPNFLAAYNAGPRRVDDYVAGNSRLPAETVSYVAMIAPRLNGGVVTDGDGSVDPNVLYASQTGINGPIVQVASASPPPPLRAMPPAEPPPVVIAAGPQPLPAPVPMYQTPVYQAPVYQASAPADSSAVAALVLADQRQPEPAVTVASSASYAPPAYSPTAYSPPAASPPQPNPAYAAAREPGQPRMVLIQSPRPPVPPMVAVASGKGIQLAAAESPAAPRSAGAGSGTWAVQVGAYTTSAQASAAALSARSQAGPLLRNASPAVGIATRADGSILFRARLAGLSADTAEKACGVLSSHQIACASVPPA